MFKLKGSRLKYLIKKLKYQNTFNLNYFYLMFAKFVNNKFN